MIKYKTLEEAQKAATLENMGRDYGTATVKRSDGYYIVVIV